MSDTALLESLNPAQCEAVSAPEEHLLILAGAGSGKTRVLVHRIAWLLEQELASPFSILAVTFTNKAAAEMKARVERLNGHPVSAMWLGTFHGLSHRLLRIHWQEAGLPEAFQIMDSDDQMRMIRRLIKQHNIDDKRWTARQVQYFINAQKDKALRAQHVRTQGDYFYDVMVTLYQAYEDNCRRAGLVDFAELLLASYELLRDCSEVRQHYQARFRHILVDEFQDTNSIQYLWLKLLAGEEAKLFVVGDDDQSIYGWRGAKIENIQQFSYDYPSAKTIRLEQNYRSTGTILSAANTIIDNNVDRLGKKLWTEQGDGQQIGLYAAFNEVDEARYIVNAIQKAKEGTSSLRDIAVLYRSNAQSRVLEDALIQAAVPYRIYGGQRFFERAEIKDALAYLRLIESRQDDAAFERVVNVPARGIGERSVAQIREQARANQCSLWQAATEMVAAALFPARAKQAVEQFLSLIENTAREVADAVVSEQTESVIKASGLIPHYEKEPGEKGQARVENLAELVSAARQFDLGEHEGTSPLLAFLAHAALEAGEAQAATDEDYVHLMTMHSAKGLEFPLVFLTGMEEGVFPHAMSSEEPGRLAEERRLCYVGITRAMEQLVITYAEKRRLKGKDAYHRASRFIRELPTELVQEVRFKNTMIRSVSSQPRGSATSQAPSSIPDTPLMVGQRVSHAKFGSGTIISYEGRGAGARVQIQFDNVGSKWLAIGVAPLVPEG